MINIADRNSASQCLVVCLSQVGDTRDQRDVNVVMNGSCITQVVREQFDMVPGAGKVQRAELS